jgi:hypothetical protein
MTENTQPTNLLTLALAAAKPQWYSGETVWIIGRKVYLKNTGGWIKLYCVGYDEPLPVFYLNPAINAWAECKTVRNNYQSWSTRAKQAIRQ